MKWITVNDELPKEGHALILKQLDGTVIDQDDVYYWNKQFATSAYEGPIYFNDITHWIYRGLNYENTFADLVEAAANFQFHSEYLLETLEGYIQETKDFKDVDEAEREALLKTLYELQPLVHQALAIKAIKKSFEK